MRIAVLNEVSAAARNPDILAALEAVEGAQVFNLGMAGPDGQPALTYIQTGLMAALLLHTGAVDTVVGGCGTGQGFLNAAMQYPGVFCGLVADPLDAWLFSQINGGNCVSLPLNKGYGWAADINLKYVLRELFRDEPGAGYPPARSESQKNSRALLGQISQTAHRDMLDILKDLDADVLAPIGNSAGFIEFLAKEGKEQGAAMAALLRQAARPGEGPGATKTAGDMP